MENSNKNRKLTAILFADIAGYTSLMQNDETSALTILNKFKDELESRVPASRGEIIQFYGDGCLAVFESPVDAVSCGKELQLKFQQEPAVPVRIGIHSGDVVFKEGNIFGDSVNVASRIESLGVPGAVLFSKRIKRDIANQPSFKVTSLGEFDFKNVNKAMEVFALANEGLAVPKRSEMEGKVKSNSSKTSSKRSIAIWGIIVSFLMVVSFFSWQYFFNPSKGFLPETIRSSMIAVLPFENKTNDPDLDILGDMAADWITEGLMNFEDLKVVSFQNIKANIKYADAGDNTSFIIATGAEKIIRGNFYLEGDQIIFQSRIVDANSGVLEKALPQISGDKNQKTLIVKTLQQRILGYFISKSNSNFSSFYKESPPHFEAYKLHTESINYIGNNNEKAIELSNKAIAIDSSYGLAYYTILVTYDNMGYYEKRDSFYQLVINKNIPLSPLLQLYFDYIKVDGVEEKSALSKKIFEKDPKNIICNSYGANYAIIRNDPEETVRICQHIDPSLVEVDEFQITFWFRVYSQALIRLNRLDEAMKVLNYLPEEYEDFWNKPLIFAKRKQDDSIQLMALKLENRNSSEDISWFYNRLALIYSVLEDKPKQKEWANKALQYLKKQPESVTPSNFNLARAYYLAEQYDEALSYYSELSRDAEYGNPYDDQGLWNYLSRIGSIYAKTGKKEKAVEVIEQLKAVPGPQPKGRYSYGIARIYAQLGDKEKAMEYVQKSFNEGFNTADGYRYQNDIDLIPLYNYPPFEKFVKYRHKKL